MAEPCDSGAWQAGKAAEFDLERSTAVQRRLP